MSNTLEVIAIILILVPHFFLQFNSGRKPHGSSHDSMLDGHRQKKLTQYVLLRTNVSASKRPKCKQILRKMRIRVMKTCNCAKCYDNFHFPCITVQKLIKT